MIIYNVTLKVATEANDAWVAWMKAEHMPELMSTGLFLDCRLCRLLEQDDMDGMTYSAQYTCSSIDQYNNYIETHAQNMRNKVSALFGTGVVAFRTIMEVI